MRQMTRLGWIVVAGMLCAGSAAHAGSVKGHKGVTNVGSGFVVHTITRTIGGKQVRESYLLRNRTTNRKRSKGYIPRCRRGLFGRVENAPCRGRKH